MQEAQTTNIEEKIMHIIIDLYQKNKIIDFNRLYNICLREFGLQKLNIDSIIIVNALENLQKQKRICFGQKIIRDFVLVNETRNLIYTFLKTHPGSKFTEIINTINLNPQLLKWNLAVLIRYNCITEVPININKIYGIYLDSREKILSYHLFRNENYQKILICILKKRVSESEISIFTNMSLNVLGYYMKILINLNVLEVQIDTTVKVYTIKEVFKKILVGMKN